MSNIQTLMFLGLVLIVGAWPTGKTSKDTKKKVAGRAILAMVVAVISILYAASLYLVTPTFNGISLAQLPMPAKELVETELSWMRITVICTAIVTLILAVREIRKWRSWDKSHQPQ